MKSINFNFKIVLKSIEIDKVLDNFKTNNFKLNNFKLNNFKLNDFVINFKTDISVINHKNSVIKSFFAINFVNRFNISK